MAVMTGYNRVNGTFCSENRFLLREILRGEWGFQGCVISDWTGTHSVWGSLEAGLDLEMPEAPGMFYKDRLNRLFHGDPNGRAEMTKPRALAILRVMMRLGREGGRIEKSQQPRQLQQPRQPQLPQQLQQPPTKNIGSCVKSCKRAQTQTVFTSLSYRLETCTFHFILHALQTSLNRFLYFPKQSNCWGSKFI